jgi:mannose-1-phosphate guanylyltransferase
VKQIVALLEKSGSSLVTEHLTVSRPWGSYTVLEEGPGFKIKRIVVKPGGKLSLQSHQHRCEHWIVVTGSATVLCNDKKLILAVNESTYIPMGAKHRLENTADEDLVMIEVQTGAVLSEDDIERFADNYGRA